MRFRALGLVVMGALAVGCADPVEGEWESEDERLCLNGTVEHASVVIDGDGTGYGDVCSCDFTFLWTRLNDERYRFDVDFEGGADCALAVDGEYDCDLRNKERLSCNNDVIGDYIKIQ